MRSFKLIIAQLLKPEVLQIWDSGLEFSNSEAPLYQTGFVSGWHSLLNHFCPVFFWSITFGGQQ